MSIVVLLAVLALLCCVFGMASNRWPWTIYVAVILLSIAILIGGLGGGKIL